MGNGFVKNHVSNSVMICSTDFIVLSDLELEESTGVVSDGWSSGSFFGFSGVRARWLGHSAEIGSGAASWAGAEAAHAEAESKAVSWALFDSTASSSFASGEIGRLCSVTGSGYSEGSPEFGSGIGIGTKRVGVEGICTGSEVRGGSEARSDAGTKLGCIDV